MSKKAHLEQEKASILAHIAEIGEPMSLGEIENILPLAINKKTLQRRIWSMVEKGFLLSSGERSHTKYYVDKDKHPIFSSDAMSLLGYLNTPSYARKRSSYQFSLVDNYIPNQTQYVPKAMRVRLYETGKRFNEQLAAGTYANCVKEVEFTATQAA
tara:strand:+ start:15800 stop:16267 length:468 start_codon:yes stop_codon:yes gene_type:complete